MPNTALTQDRLEGVMPTTATRLVVMLYDGAIAALENAVQAIEKGDGEERCRAVNMAVDILAHLCLALDTEKGGEIAENLGRLYSFMISRLQRVNLLNDPEPARETIRLLEVLHGAWRELDQKMSEEALGGPRGESGRERAAIRAAG